MNHKNTLIIIHNKKKNIKSNSTSDYEFYNVKNLLNDKHAFLYVRQCGIFDAKCVAKGGVPLGEPIPVKKEKRGKMGANPQLTQYLIALDNDMHHHIINMAG